MKNQKDYKNHKGFTLVELIVVIVILAILAAILIPGLLKWIDQARKKQYELEARNIYLATEASLVELYTWGFADTGDGKPWDLYALPDEGKGCFTISWNNENWLEYVANMSGMKKEDISYLRCYIDKGKLIGLAIKYKSSDNKVIMATIKEPGDDYKAYINAHGPDSQWGSWTWSDDGAWNIEVQ